MGELKDIGNCLSRRKIAFTVCVFSAVVIFFVIRGKYFNKSNYLTSIGSRTSSFQPHNHSAKHQSVTLRGDEVNIWESWVARNPHLSPIGDIYDKCNNTSRIKIGKVVLEANSKTGGVHITSYMNCTYDHVITTSSAHMEVYYEDNILYKKRYDMCESASTLETPYTCPIPKGKLLVVREVSVMPSYIPRGKYRIFAYVKDQNGDDIGCTYAEFRTGRRG